ncbi:Protein NRT1/ PTR FAMILY 4.6 [Camellia lanceoleosa]|uniref:Protein NRT1/ PTR FAMILY 4.6 n=1 Tax=Camellia lanceoleosa TaxID=1840588 RepID=A0ACC0GME4_9ERIC|nr:Protein NRT1/ PTR FAMILY 4.6 [Camellia lanceoleosa]
MEKAEFVVGKQAHFPKLIPPPCNIYDPTTHCSQVKGGNAALLFVALYLVAIGSAGVKATSPAYGADQFEEKNPKEAREMSSFFNWLLLAGCLGTVASLTLIVWIQDNKVWDKGFGISAIAMLVGIMVFVAGLPQYRIHVVQGSNVIIEIIQVWI